ncbi:MAG: hypothetical protein U9N59_05845 [Campylobacterota bacterium]|nr:hypothetical protein [Campylobacterota bacterium]
MKALLHILVYSFLFIGCTTTVQKIEVVDIKPKKQSISIVKPTVDTKKVDVVEKTDTIPEDVAEEEVTVKEDNKLVIIFPSVTIGKYALEATNTINTYLLYKNKQIKLTVLDMVVQNENNLLEVFNIVQEKQIKNVVAMITKDNLDILNSIEGIKDIKIYLPLINKSEIENIDQLSELNIVFGAINYQEQFNKLIEYSDSLSLAELYDNTAIGNTLHNYLKSYDLKYTKKVDDNNGNYKNFLKNKKLNNAVVILNTPIVKSSILLSAITAGDLNISKIVSTQLNYTPLIFSLTQKQDRKKLIIANSIGKIPDDLLEYNQLIGNNILYSWVNYSSIIGVEYLLNGNIDLFDDLKIEENQIIYPVNLYKVGDNSFELINTTK